MTFIYKFVCTDTTNITIKENLFDQRLNNNLTITPTSIAPTHYDFLRSEYIFTFNSALDTASWETIYNLVSVIGYSRPVILIHPTPMIITTVNGKTPTNYNDNLNGYISGDIA